VTLHYKVRCVRAHIPCIFNSVKLISLYGNMQEFSKTCVWFTSYYVRLLVNIAEPFYIHVICVLQRLSWKKQWHCYNLIFDELTSHNKDVLTRKFTQDFPQYWRNCVLCSTEWCKTQCFRRPGRTLGKSWNIDGRQRYLLVKRLDPGMVIRLHQI